jgi:hypothetical protein
VKKTSALGVRPLLRRKVKQRKQRSAKTSERVAGTGSYISGAFGHTSLLVGGQVSLRKVKGCAYSAE